MRVYAFSQAPHPSTLFVLSRMNFPMRRNHGFCLFESSFVEFLTDACSALVLKSVCEARRDMGVVVLGNLIEAERAG